MDQVRPSDTTTARRGADPVQRWGSDAEVDDFIAYLSTDAASWIQGQSINQDGGLVMEH